MHVPRHIAVIVTCLLAVGPSAECAVMVAVPVPTPVIAALVGPVDCTLAIAGFDVVHAKVAAGTHALAASYPVAVTSLPPPIGIASGCGLTTTLATEGGGPSPVTVNPSMIDPGSRPFHQMPCSVAVRLVQSTTSV